MKAAARLRQRADGAPPRRRAGENTDLPGGICSRCDAWAPHLVPAYWPAEPPRPLLCPGCCVHLAGVGGHFDRTAWPDVTHLGYWAEPHATEETG